MGVFVKGQSARGPEGDPGTMAGVQVGRTVLFRGRENLPLKCLIGRGGFEFASGKSHTSRAHSDQGQPEQLAGGPSAARALPRQADLASLPVRAD